MTSSATAPHPSDCRCACGSLLARLVTGGVELKCRRCKRTLFVPLAEREGPEERPHRAPAARAGARG